MLNWLTNEIFLAKKITCSRRPTSANHPYLGFTIHSFQGKTIKGQRLYISLHLLNSPQLLYTALSRVEHSIQIRFITPPPPEEDSEDDSTQSD